MKNNLQESWWLSLATLGDVRYSSAPGSVASALMLPVVLALYHFEVSASVYALLIGGLALASYMIIQKVLPAFDMHDPKEIVLDECLGMLITFWTIPVSAFSIVVGFLLFRLFDISKLFGVRAFEKLPGAWGVLADDVAAGLLALILLKFLVPIVCVGRF
ncbi:MAG: phosphatidylglycerophosphatase A [Candidatus Babeliales bacterium]